MSDYLDYLDWRGDLTFDNAPLNEVDNYILCKVGCPDYSGIVPENGEVLMSDAIWQYMQSLGDDEPETALGPLSSDYLIQVLYRLPHTQRFGKLKICDYVNKIDMVREEQFSALTVLLPDGTRFVTFRGTGDTIVSWKEDFLLSVEDMVPAQKDAAAYLWNESKKSTGPLIVGGHSKGGNLAVYAAMKMPPEVQDRIAAIYNNDGPGFRRDVSQTAEYLRLKPRLHTIVSQHTVIGRLLYHEEDCEIVKAGEFGVVNAHDGFTWELHGPRFVRCDGYSLTSKAFDTAINGTLNSMDLEQRKEFVEEFFSVLTSSGAETLSDLTEHKLRQAAELAVGMRESPAVRKFLLSLSSLFIQETVAGTRMAIPKPRFSFGRDKTPKEQEPEED